MKTNLNRLQGIKVELFYVVSFRESGIELLKRSLYELRNIRKRQTMGL